MALAPYATQETVLQDFAHRLRRLRAARHLRQLDMEELGLSYKYYQRLETGQVNPTLLTMYRLAVALDVPVSAFFCPEPHCILRPPAPYEV
jgi:transcriptional regulator with XRE-family HTH domain